MMRADQPKQKPVSKLISKLHKVRLLSLQQTEMVSLLIHLALTYSMKLNKLYHTKMKRSNKLIKRSKFKKLITIK